LNEFESKSNSSELHSIETGPSKVQNLEIKYGFEDFDERNNFIYMNFSRFEMDFELKFREVSMS
jgi:hypothetical protein